VISLLRHEVRVRRRTILGWSIGLAFFGVMYMSFYPALPDEMRSLDLESIDIYRSMGVQSMATFDGYMQSTVFNFLPLLVGAFGVVLGAGAIAGEEGAGTLELLAALPISRLQLYVAKAAALIIAAFLVLLAVALILTGVFLAIQSEIDTSVAALDVFSVMLSHWLIAFVFLSLSLFLSAYLPSRGSALAASVAVLVVTFFGNNLAGMVTELERIQPLFPFSYFVRVAGMFTGDVPWRDVLILLSMGVVFIVLGMLSFQRRDLTVGAWPWQRPRPDGAQGSDSTRTIGSRRVVVPLVVLGMMLTTCTVAAVAIAAATSEDFRSDVKERFGFGDEDAVTWSGVFEEGQAEVEAPASGRVESVPASVGDEVEEGDVLVVLADQAESPLRVEAQQVMEGAWVLLDELSTGLTSGNTEDIEAAVEQAGVAADAADRSLRDARTAGDATATVDELETRSELAQANLRVAEARLALAEDRLSDADVQALEDAMRLAEPRLGGADVDAGLRAVRAPFSGTVTAMLVIPGEAVSTGQTLVRMEPE
jgi:ABC-2 type transport system permease protein